MPWCSRLTKSWVEEGHIGESRPIYGCEIEIHVERHSCRQRQRIVVASNHACNCGSKLNGTCAMNGRTNRQQPEVGRTDIMAVPLTHVNYARVVVAVGFSRSLVSGSGRKGGNYYAYNFGHDQTNLSGIQTIRHLLIQNLLFFFG